MEGTSSGGIYDFQQPQSSKHAEETKYCKSRRCMQTREQHLKSRDLRTLYKKR